MFQFLKSRQWALTRRLVLLGIIAFLLYRNYGGNVISYVSGPNPKKDIIVTKAEFRADVPGEKPIWIIGFHNNSRSFAYDQIQLEATYFDKDGKQLEQDTLVVHHKVGPGADESLASSDLRARGAATKGTLAVVDARRVK